MSSDWLITKSGLFLIKGVTCGAWVLHYTSCYLEYLPSLAGVGCYVDGMMERPAQPVRSFCSSLSDLAESPSRLILQSVRVHEISSGGSLSRMPGKGKHNSRLECLVDQVDIPYFTPLHLCTATLEYFLITHNMSAI